MQKAVERIRICRIYPNVTAFWIQIRNKLFMWIWIQSSFSLVNIGLFLQLEAGAFHEVLETWYGREFKNVQNL